MSVTEGGRFWKKTYMIVTAAAKTANAVTTRAEISFDIGGERSGRRYSEVVTIKSLHVVATESERPTRTASVRIPISFIFLT